MIQDCHSLKLCIDRLFSHEDAAIPEGRRDVHVWYDIASQDIKLAVAARKRWPNAYDIKCTFLDGSAIQRAIVRDYARSWEEYANISFRFGSREDAVVRIS